MQKRSYHIVRHELFFLQSLVDERVVDVDSISQAVDSGLDRLAQEQRLLREDLIKIILVNFRYSILEAVKESSLEFDFKKLWLKDICYFYFIHRINDPMRYLTDRN